MKIGYIYKKMDHGLQFTTDSGIYDYYLYHQDLEELNVSINFFPYLSKKKILFQNMSSVVSDCDIVHSSGYYIPIVKNKPFVATIPDASLCLFSSEKFSFLAKTLLKHHLKYVDHFIVTNPTVIPELKKSLKIHEKNISVTSIGLDKTWFHLIDEKMKINILQKYHIKPNFFLCVGQIHPRKNLINILDAYKKLPNEIQCKHQLVIIGDVLFDDSRKTGLHVELASNYQNIHWIRSASLNDLQALFQSALGYLHLSNFEHFHFHLLAAFATKIPVIAVNNEYSSLYIKNKALEIQKGDTDSIYQALLDLIKNPTLDSSLLNSGFQFAKEFSWKNALNDTINVLKKLI